MHPDIKAYWEKFYGVGGDYYYHMGNVYDGLCIAAKSSTIKWDTFWNKIFVEPTSEWMYYFGGHFYNEETALKFLKLKAFW